MICRVPEWFCLDAAPGQETQVGNMEKSERCSRFYCGRDVRKCRHRLLCGRLTGAFRKKRPGGTSTRALWRQWRKEATAQRRDLNKPKQ